jgi:hypothetical protein
LSLSKLLWGYDLLYFYYISELQMNTENSLIVDGVELVSRSAAEPRPTKSLSMAKTTLARKLKTGDGIDVREQLKGQSKPIFYNGILYPSARHLLLANPLLVAGGDIETMITLLNQRARRASARGETLVLSLDGMSALLGVDKLRYMDEFDAWVDTVSNRVGNAGMIEMFIVISCNAIEI